MINLVKNQDRTTVKYIIEISVQFQKLSKSFILDEMTKRNPLEYEKPTYTQTK